MENSNNTYRQLAVSIALLLILLVVVVLFFSFFFGTPHEESKILVEEEKGFFINPFNAITVEAKAIYVYDIAHGEVLYERNNEQQLPLASLTKLMTVLIASEELPPTTSITITSSAISHEGDTGLVAGEKWSAEDLIDFTLLASSNDGAYALANAVSAHNSFIARMNRRAGELNLSQTFFTNSTGLDRSQNTSGSYGSARDVAHLFAYLVTQKPHLLESTRNGEETFLTLDGTTHVASNTNQGVGRIPGFIASKTGYTDLAGGNLVIAYDAGIGRPIVVAVLGSTSEDRFTDVEKLARASLKYLQKR